MATVDGLISSFLSYRRTLNPKKLNPVARSTIRVLSSLKDRPRGVSHSASFALTCSACWREWHNATRSSAYLTTKGEPGTVSPAWFPVVR